MKLITHSQLLPTSRMVEIYFQSPYFIMAWYSIKHRDNFFFYPLVTNLNSVAACRGFKAWGGTSYSVAQHHHTTMEKLRKLTILTPHVPRNYGKWLLISMQCTTLVSKKEMKLNALSSCEGRNYLNRSESESWQKTEAMHYPLDCLCLTDAAIIPLA